MMGSELTEHVQHFSLKALLRKTKPTAPHKTELSLRFPGVTPTSPPSNKQLLNAQHNRITPR